MHRVDERFAGVEAIEAASTASNAPFGGGAAVQLSIDGRQAGTAERAPLVDHDCHRHALLRGVAVVLVVAALAACIAPARGAIRVDPITLLRSGP
jgi:hypothetical protein